MKQPSLTLILLVAFAAGSAITPAGAEHDHEKVRCFVRYAPEKVRDFSDLWDVRHRDDGKMVNYLMDDGNVIRYRYKSPEDARKWIDRVYKQLRECSD